MNQDSPKLFYAVPNFQNPSGISHSEPNRDTVAEIVSGHDTFLVEDDPYGELQFSGSFKTSYYSRIPGQTILLGSFSKIFVPSFRIGWLAAPENVIEKLLIAKQASDLHTNYFGRRILYQYLTDNDVDEHISLIKEKYLSQKEAMIRAIRKYFPQGVNYSNPDGGMFLWVILPQDISARGLFDRAIAQNVAFVPGDPFYINPENINTLRLNFSCVNEGMIEKGIKILGNLINNEIEKNHG